MDSLLTKIEIKLNENIFLKDPNSSELGKRIVSGGIDLISEIGFELFNFKKLGERIKSPEASIYRYFESKHKLLLYVTSWYWSWLEYQIVFALANVESPHERLKKAIYLLTSSMENEPGSQSINMKNLYNLVVADSSKSYLTKAVDADNKSGVFSGYKQLVGRVSDIVLEINAEYKYPHMLISTIIEGAHHQRYFADHLPRLTDVVEGEDSIQDFYTQLVFTTIEC